MLSKTLTIMFVDLQGYTSLTSQKTREEHQLFVTEIHSFIGRHAQAKRGNLVKTMGDGFMITFESPTDAINCGMAIQEEIRRRNSNILDESHLLKLRVGISTGEVSIDEHNDVYGDAVNIAARIEKFCDPNEVFISESTYLAMNRSEVNARDLGPLKFKNVSEDVRVFKILKEKKGISGGLKRFPRAVIGRGWMIGLALAAVVVLGVLLFWKRSEKPSERFQPPTARQSSANPMDQCQGSVQRYCRDVQLGEGRIIRCLMEHFNELDPACVSALPQGEQNPGMAGPSSPNKFGNTPQPSSDNPGNVREHPHAKGFLNSCDEDVRNYCSAVQPGGGRIIQCLKEHSNELSRNCQDSLRGNAA